MSNGDRVSRIGEAAVQQESANRGIIDFIQTEFQRLTGEPLQPSIQEGRAPLRGPAEISLPVIDIFDSSGLQPKH